MLFRSHGGNAGHFSFEGGNAGHVWRQNVGSKISKEMIENRAIVKCKINFFGGRSAGQFHFCSRAENRLVLKTGRGLISKLAV